jgi:hypothetical protein
MIGLITAGIGAAIFRRLNVNFTMGVSRSYTSSHSLTTNQPTPLKAPSTRRMRSPNGLLWKRTLTDSVTQTPDGQWRLEIVTRDEQTLGFEKSYIAGMVAGAALFAMTVHPLLNLIPQYRDFDNRYDQYGLVQIWPGFTLNK